MKSLFFLILKKFFSLLKGIKFLLNLITKKILSLLKIKKVLILLIFVFFLFLLTPLSLHQINKKVEQFIHLKSQILVRNFQKQIGLEISWENLDFKVSKMRIHLQNVKLTKVKASKRNKFLQFLNQDQKVQSIDIYPSLFSLISKKNIVFSKVKIDTGDLYLKTSHIHFKTSKTKKVPFDLPIEKIIIKNTNLTLTHQDHNIRWTGINWTIQKTSPYRYHFKNSVEEFYINQNQPFFSKAEGFIEKNKLHIEKMKWVNESLDVKIELLEVLFDSRGLKNIKIKSSGEMPFDLVNQILQIFQKKRIQMTSLISYNLNLQFNKTKGYNGTFQLQSSDFVFKDTNYKSLSIQGQFVNKTVLIDKGFLKVNTQSSIKINKIKLLLSSSPLEYDVSLQTDNLNLFSTLNDVFNIKLPLRADSNGTIQCKGQIYSYLNCQIKNQSSQINITNWKQKIISFYNMNTDINLEWKGKKLNFEIFAKKEDSSVFQIFGVYHTPSNLLTLNSDGFFHVGRDIVFNTKLKLEGSVKLNNSSFKITKKDFTAKGFIDSPLLQIEKYKLKNISSGFSFKNEKIVFSDLQSTFGKSNYKGSFEIDFLKKESIIKATFSFLDTQDIKEAIEPNIKWPLNIKGTGTASVFLKIPWNPKIKKSFFLSGNLFNTSIQTELFQRISFDISSEKGQGLIHELSFKKGSGVILTSGSFDKNFNLNLTAKNIPIESLNFLNTLLPFKQSGFLTFDIKILGLLENPKGVGDFTISKAFLYSAPISDTKAKIKIDRKGVTLSGNIANEFLLEKFYYPFSKKKLIQITGQFSNFDFIKTLAAKHQKEFIEKYYSELKGHLNLFIDKTKKRVWKGVLNIENLFISKGKKWIKSNQPFSIIFSKKSWLLNPVSFSQYNQKNLEIKKRNNNLTLSGESSLSFLSILFPHLKELDGEIHLDLITSRNLKKWSPQGALKIKKGLISIGTLPDFSDIDSSLKINNTKIKISQFKSSIGLGSGSGNGDIIYNFTDPARINLFLNFSDVHLNLPKDFLTQGSGSVKIKGNKYPYLLSGHYFIDSGNIVKNFASPKTDVKNYYTFLKQKKSEEFSPFQFNFKIKTKQPITINNSILNSSIKGESLISGSLKTPSLTGNFKIAKTKEDNLILFRDQEFKIISGAVQFKNSPPDNPLINIKAQTLFKEKSIDTFENNKETLTEYKIFLTVNGLAKNLNFSLESSPPINEKEIISMLTFGMSSKYFDENVKDNITDYSYHLLGSFLLNQSLNRELRNKLGLDLNISPQINTLNESVTKIALKKVWFDKLKTTFSRTIEEFPESDIRFKYVLNPNISLTTFWENTEHIELDSSEKQKMGLDFEFTFDF